MPVNVLDQAISSSAIPPKGIKVGTELWKKLNGAGRITWKRGYLEGVVDSGIDFPVLNGNIFVHVAPELNDMGYDLP